VNSFCCKAIDNEMQFSSYKSIVYFICLIAALGGLLFGLDQGFIANSLGSIEAVYHLGVVGSGKYSAILATGAVVGALLSGIFARILGRKKSLVLAGFIFSAASFVSMFLPPISILSSCRFFLGFGVGISSFIVPLYLSETAPAAIRGAMGTLFQLMITIGIFLISFANAFIAKVFVIPTTALPIMFSVIVFFAFLMFVSAFVLPESPRWLMLKGKKREAKATLKKVLNTDEEVECEINEIGKTLADTKEAGIGILFKGYFFKILLIGIFLQVFQQLVGINVMIYYAPTIFGYAGMKGWLAMLAVPTVNVIFTIPAIYLVEKWGRKKLLHVGAIFMLVTMIVAGLVFQHIGTISDPSLIGELPKNILLIAIVVYIFGFAVAWGPLVWLVCSEIFPLKGREIGMTITTMVNWTFAGIVLRYALSFMEAFGRPLLFYLFAGFCALAIVFVAMFVPETRGVTLEVLEKSLKKRRNCS